MDEVSWKAAVAALNDAPDCRTAAHSYLDLGLTPIPWIVTPEGKKQARMIKDLHYSSEPMYRTSHEAIESWTATFQVGLVMSVITRWWCIDVDNPDSFSLMQHEIEIAPPVLTQISGRQSGGFHLVYYGCGSQPWPAQGADPIGGVEVRSNGFIAAAPSLHMSGKRYQWQA